MGRVILFHLVALLTVLAAAASVRAAETTPAPVAAKAAGAPAEKEAAEDSAIVISLDEVKTLLARHDTPRLRVTNSVGAQLTGLAITIDGGKLQLDVTGELVGIGGNLGVPLNGIVRIEALVPMTARQREEAMKASAAYLASIRAPKPAPSPPSGETPPAADAPPEQAAAAPEGEEVKKDYLALYPPAEGWGPKRMADITQKAVVLRLRPFGKEKEFLEDYDAWAAAYSEERTRQLAVLADLKAKGEEVPADFKVLPALEPKPAMEGAVDAPVGNDATGEPVGEPSEPVGQ